MSALAVFRQIQSLSSAGELRQAITIILSVVDPVFYFDRYCRCPAVSRAAAAAAAAARSRIVSHHHHASSCCSSPVSVSVISNLEGVRSGAEGHSDKASARCLSYRPRVTIATI